MPPPPPPPSCNPGPSSSQPIKFSVLQWCCSSLVIGGGEQGERRRTRRMTLLTVVLLLLLFGRGYRGEGGATMEKSIYRHRPYRFSRLYYNYTMCCRRRFGRKRDVDRLLPRRRIQSILISSDVAPLPLSSRCVASFSSTTSTYVHISSIPSSIHHLFGFTISSTIVVVRFLSHYFNTVHSRRLHQTASRHRRESEEPIISRVSKPSHPFFVIREPTSATLSPFAIGKTLAFSSFRSLASLTH